MDWFLYDNGLRNERVRPKTKLSGADLSILGRRLLRALRIFSYIKQKIDKKD